jgi:hypothetical protein
VVLKLQGPGISTLQSASSGYLFYSRLASDTDARVITLGNVTGGPLLTFKLAPGSAASAYTATLVQVASRGDVLRSSTTGYALTVTAAP